jgi:thiol-disulfide isomerase/thioredoxin
MSFDKTKIVHLEDQDFNTSSLLHNGTPIKSGKFFIMIHADFCGYCKQAKPAFIKASKEVGTLDLSNGVIFASIHSDSSNPKEAALAKRISKISGIPINGIPAYLLYNAESKKFIKYDGPRTEKGFIDFIASH